MNQGVSGSAISAELPNTAGKPGCHFLALLLPLAANQDVRVRNRRCVDQEVGLVVHHRRLDVGFPDRAQQRLLAVFVIRLQTVVLLSKLLDDPMFGLVAA